MMAKRDAHWDYHVSGAKFEKRLEKAQRAVGAHEAADRSKERAEAHKNHLKDKQ